jgi:hypothetical protein
LVGNGSTRLVFSIPGTTKREHFFGPSIEMFKETTETSEKRHSKSRTVFITFRKCGTSRRQGGSTLLRASWKHQEIMNYSMS